MAGDALWDDVVFIHGWEGADGTFPSPEESQDTRTMSYFGNAQADTAQFMFGASSVLYDGLGDFTGVPQDNALSLTNQDFTIETWLRFNVVVSGLNGIASNYDATGDQRSYFFAHDGAANNVQFSYYVGGGGVANANTLTGSFTPSTDTWYHYAVSRNNGTLYLHVSGVEVGNDGGAIGTSTISDSLAEITKFGIIDISTTAPFNGWMDETRFTLGTARYGAGPITVPTAAWERGPLLIGRQRMFNSM